MGSIMVGRQIRQRQDEPEGGKKGEVEGRRVLMNRLPSRLLRRPLLLGLHSATIRRSQDLVLLS
jgi:hypothetical protein